jgi:hypothetical protein
VEEFAPVRQGEEAPVREDAPAEPTPRKAKAAPPPKAESRAREEEESATQEARPMNLSFSSRSTTAASPLKDETLGGVAIEKKQARHEAEWIANPHLKLRELCRQVHPADTPRQEAAGRTFYRIDDFFVEVGICADPQRRIRVLSDPDARAAWRDLRLPTGWRHVFLLQGDDILLLHANKRTE